MNENSFSVLQTNIRRLLLHLGMCPTLLGYECLALAMATILPKQHDDLLLYQTKS